jgi:hypothetical protein
MENTLIPVACDSPAPPHTLTCHSPLSTHCPLAASFREQQQWRRLTGTMLVVTSFLDD